ncbi:hypothetical protein ABPG77_007927 [Micractinium sp. CCAP 211/92]
MSTPAGQHSPPDSSAEEQRNLAVVKEYMEVAYDPARASAAAVEHLVAPGSRFVAPSTFPQAVNDLRITSFDVQFAKGGWVCLRYSADGSHCGEPHRGKIQTFWKDWDKLSMWAQLGWLQGEPPVLA